MHTTDSRLKYIYSKTAGCKKGAALFKMAGVKKGQPRNGCDGVG